MFVPPLAEVFTHVHPSRRLKDTPVHDTLFSLCPQNLFDLGDFVLNFVDYFFTGTCDFLLQLLRLTLCFLDESFCLCTGIGINILYIF